MNRNLAAACAALLLLQGCAGLRFPGFPSLGRPGTPQEGIASWYGKEFARKRTASGESFDPDGFTAAHRSLPFGTKVRVTNLANGRTVEVRVNDRGPWHRGRIVDVSHGAARALGFARQGTTRVRVVPLR